MRRLTSAHPERFTCRRSKPARALPKTPGAFREPRGACPPPGSPPSPLPSDAALYALVPAGSAGPSQLLLVGPAARRARHPAGAVLARGDPAGRRGSHLESPPPCRTERARRLLTRPGIQVRTIREGPAPPNICTDGASFLARVLSRRRGDPRAAPIRGARPGPRWPLLCGCGSPRTALPSPKGTSPGPCVQVPAFSRFCVFVLSFFAFE